MKKRIPSPEELVNDPSLRWTDYKQWEGIWSDLHQQELRFVKREKDRIKLATMDGIADVPGFVPLLSVRRTTVQTGRMKK